MSTVAELARELSGSSRRARQNAAEELAELVKANPADLLPYIVDFTDALNRPESQTRWECLDILTELTALDANACVQAVPGAETALFDEENGMVRLWAMKFLCKLGAAGEELSMDVWPLIDEALQCYHGDIEFMDMLNAVVEFSQADIAPEVKKALANRMAFDAENARGVLQRKALQIIENVK